uniref:Uncharacterized protein n=1 Tax=Candidatus Kentrum sp. DK TaxID=2126562 RepID=A0A450SPB6_9GAMM|nr:MAG: hypothetical protein BECKDK2373B_GA0170837_10543 [Candidatus Kentron sp. DK]
MAKEQVKMAKERGKIIPDRRRTIFPRRGVFSTYRKSKNPRNLSDLGVRSEEKRDRD